MGIVGDGAGKNIGHTTAGVGDAKQGKFDGLKAAVEIEIEMGELAGTEFIVDAHAGVNFFAAVTVGFEAVFGFEQFDLRGVLFGLCGFRGRLSWRGS